MTPPPGTLPELIAHHARHAPDAPAILAPGRPTLGFRALTAQLDAVGASLAAAGFGRAHRVALALPDGPELAVALLAVGNAAVCAPFNPALDEASYRAAIEHLRIDGLIVAAHTDTAASRAARSLALPVLALEWSPADPAGSFTLSTPALRPAVAASTPAPEDIALLLQTSGTTSRPKAVPLAHRLLVETTLTRAFHLRLTSADRCLCVAPLFNSSGIRRCVLPPLAVGGSVVCTPGLKGHSFVDWLDAYAPTYYTGSPAQHRAVLDELERRQRVPRSTLRFILTGSTALPPDVERRLEEAFDAPVLQAYAMTEAGIIAQNPLPPGRRLAGSVGLPHANAFAILGNGNALLAAGDTGEILVRGPEVFGGYEDDPESNRRAFFDGWFRTGDLGYVDADGYLHIVGRVNELINRGGFKVAPSAVDAAFIRHPDVLDAATFPVPHATLGEDVVTAAVVRDAGGVTARELRDFAFAQLPAFMVPTQVVLVRELPRSPAGKVQRRELASALRSQLRSEFAPPRDAGEALVAGVYAAVLGVERVGAFDNFFELGGDSLRGAQVVARINTAIGSQIDVVSLFQCPSVAELAALIAQLADSGGQRDDAQAVPRRGSIPRRTSGTSTPGS